MAFTFPLKFMAAAQYIRHIPSEEGLKRVSTEEQNHSDNSEENVAGSTEAQAEQQAPQPEDETPKLDDHVEEPAAPGVEALEAEVATLKDELLRVHADMQNLRRRVDRDVENAHKYALERFVGELVSVVDNLERATSTIDKDDDKFAAVGEGVELTLKSFLDVLAKFKVEALDPAGETFDPEKHQAMTTVPNPDVAPNTVMEVFQKGYLLNGRLIRPAMVVVSQG